jgi:hypothetical protein
MMASDLYYVNKNAQNTGEHEVHKGDCPVGPLPENSQYLGVFSSCKDAVEKAKEYYANVDGCAVCSPACHTK